MRSYEEMSSKTDENFTKYLEYTYKHEQSIRLKRFLRLLYELFQTLVVAPQMRHGYLSWRWTSETIRALPWYCR